jgi:hypothetical protein
MLREPPDSPYPDSLEDCPYEDEPYEDDALPPEPELLSSSSCSSEPDPLAERPAEDFVPARPLRERFFPPDAPRPAEPFPEDPDRLDDFPLERVPPDLDDPPDLPRVPPLLDHPPEREPERPDDPDDAIAVPLAEQLVQGPIQE